MAEADPEELLPESDRDFLVEKDLDYDVKRVGNDVHVIFRGYELPDAYTPRTVDLRIILPAGYPNANLDMFWTYPEVRLANGAEPDRCQVRQSFDGQDWQRWSRHFEHPWRQGIDDLRTFYTTIGREISRGV